ncbi:formylglycine-generating enzyme required for sulfatase activity [Sinorhizobium medicae]
MKASLNSVVELEPAAEMVWVPGATFMMGSNDHYPEEAPAPPGNRGRILD